MCHAAGSFGGDGLEKGVELGEKASDEDAKGGERMLDPLIWLMLSLHQCQLSGLLALVLHTNDAHAGLALGGPAPAAGDLQVEHVI